MSDLYNPSVYYKIEILDGISESYTEFHKDDYIDRICMNKQMLDNTQYSNLEFHWSFYRGKYLSKSIELYTNWTWFWER